MDNKQESRFAMMLAVRDFFNKNTTVTAGLPGFSPLFASYMDAIDRINVIWEEQERDRTGISDKKEEYRINLATKGYDVCKKTHVYATMTGNTILAKEVGYSESKLTRASDGKLKERSMIIYDKARANAAELVAYGVTAEDIEELKSYLDLFMAAIPTPRLGRTEGKAATDELKRLFKVCDGVLKKSDLLVEVVRTSNPPFYKSYKDNRKVIDTAAGSLALTAKITDSASGVGIKGVKATFVLQNGADKSVGATGSKPLVKLTSEMGIFRVKNMPDGIYTATLAKTGYKTVTVTVSVANGEMTVLNVQLEKN